LLLPPAALIGFRYIPGRLITKFEARAAEQKDFPRTTATRGEVKRGKQVAAASNNNRT